MKLIYLVQWFELEAMFFQTNSLKVYTLYMLGVYSSSYIPNAVI
jgi:hypothetical protein